VNDLNERIRRELERLEPSPGGFEKTLRRVRRRERNRRVSAGVVGLLLMAGLATGLWLSLGPQQRQPVGPPSPTWRAVPIEPRLFLAGDGEMWVVDVGTGSVRHLRLPELSPGDPPYRIVRRGAQLVLWGSPATYVLDPAVDGSPEVLVEGSLIFIPSATPDRVWVGIGRPEELSAIREVALDGRVTVPDIKPPGGRWPVAATKSALAFQLPDGRLEVWDPLTGEVLRRLPGVFPVATYGNLLAWCADLCETLHVTDVVTGEEVEVSPPPGTYRFEPYGGAFSPDGRMIAVPVHTDPRPTTRKLQLALVDAGAGTAASVEGTAVEGYVFVDWSPSGNTVFISSGERFAERILIEYRLGADRATRLRVEVGDFYGMAAA
jgi:hypothetical protein